MPVGKRIERITNDVAERNQCCFSAMVVATINIVGSETIKLSQQRVL